MMVGKPCRMLAVLPVILWTVSSLQSQQAIMEHRKSPPNISVLWCLMALASLATVLHFEIVLYYDNRTMKIEEAISRRDSLYRTLTNNPLPLGSECMCFLLSLSTYYLLYECKRKLGFSVTNDCNTTYLYNLTSHEVAIKVVKAGITDEMRGAGCTVNGASLPLDIAAFFVTLSSRVPSAVLLALTVTWLYKMMVGKPCRMLAVLPVILWTGKYWSLIG
eukprot:sb/3469884/